MVVFLIISVSLISFPFWQDGVDFATVEIKSGDGIFSIAEMLEDEGAVIWRYPFILYVALIGERNNLKAGRYELSSDMSIKDIAEMIISGDGAYETLTFIEGWSLVEMGLYLQSREFTSKEDFFDVVGLSEPQANLIDSKARKGVDFNDDFLILRDLPEEMPLEGYLFPDTYKVEDNNVENLVYRMISNLENRIGEDLLEEIASEKNIHEVITKASLIEKEVSKEEDRRMVADILKRRKEAGMPLQIDATVNYITGRRDINVTISETEINSPYNTYQRIGLPVGPISNPGISSILAVLNPIENDFWYYLSDPETGKTIFSRNHLEHIQAKNKYLR